MLASIQAFFNSLIQTEDAEVADRQQLELAAACLLFEIAAIDYDVRGAELNALRTALADTLGLERTEIDQLVRLAGEENRRATDMHAFTREINEHFDYEQKQALMASLWRVAYADGRIDRYEEHYLRRIADLLYLTHTDFIQAKLTVAAEQQP